MDARQLEVLQHALGVDEYGRGPMYRNHFCAGGDDVEICQSLVDLGYMRRLAKTEWLPYFNCCVTKEGKLAMLRESPAPPKLTRSQKRYQRYLDSDLGLTFGEWLRWDAAENTK